MFYFKNMGGLLKLKYEVTSQISENSLINALSVNNDYLKYLGKFKKISVNYSNKNPEINLVFKQNDHFQAGTTQHRITEILENKRENILENPPETGLAFIIKDFEMKLKYSKVKKK